MREMEKKNAKKNDDKEKQRMCLKSELLRF